MFNFSTKEQRKTEEQLYAAVANEIEQNQINKALWAKAMSHSGNNKQQTQALYIKYRVQKLKDEIDEQTEDVRRKQDKEARIQKSIDTITTTIDKTLNIFHWLILLLILGALAVAGFATLIFFDSNDAYAMLWMMGGGAALILGLWLYYLTRKISKSDDYTYIKSKLNVLFVILIPFSLVAMVIGFLAPLIAIFGFIAFVSLTIQSIKFNSAFRYAKKNNLV